MTTAAVKKSSRRRCPGCGTRFTDRSRTQTRVYCETCKPPRIAGAAGEARRNAVPKVRRVPGEAMTLPHFRAWTRRLWLKGDKRFVLEPWQELFVDDVLALIAAGGRAECWLLVPEGNGKSTLVAVLVLYVLEFAEEASVPIAASARDQAEIIFEQATGFGRRSPALRGRFRFKPGLREVTFSHDREAKIFASDAGTGDGIIPSPLEVLDELHRHRDLDLYRTWSGKLEKEGAVLVVISTAGEPGGEFEEQRAELRRRATSVERDGCFARYAGPGFVMHEYAVPEDGDVDDLELVKAANPSRRITVKTLEGKRQRLGNALSHWRRLTCNMPTRDVDAAITEREWAAAASKVRIPPGEAVWVGLDLGWKYDTTAIVPLWLRDREFRLFGPARILAPPAEGSVDARDVERALIELHAETPIDTVVMDPSHSAQVVAQWIEHELGCRVVERQQTLPLQALDYSRFMEALREGWLHHSGDEAFARHVLNAVARVLPRGDIVFERPSGSRTSHRLQRLRVVDALDAAAMVHSAAVAEMDTPKLTPMVALA